MPTSPSGPRIALTCALFAACATPGGQDFELGRSLREQGDLEAAHAAFVRAAEANPEDPAMAEARRETGGALAATLAETAEIQSAEGDHDAAASAWKKAAAYAPENADYAVRAELAKARAQNLGPDDMAATTAQLTTAHPDSAVAKAAADKANADAYAYHLALGREALAKRSGSEALDHFEAAKRLDPTTPGLSLDDYDEAGAWALAEEAEAKAASGDAVGAYESYRAAYAKKPLPEVARAMKTVKRRAAATLGKLEKARGLAERRRYAAALTLYDQLLASGSAPESVEDEAAAVREDLVRAGAEDARRAGERGDLRRGVRTLSGVVPHVDLTDAGRDQLRAALALIKEGAPAQAWETARGIGLPESSPVLGATRALAVAEARRQVGSARRLSRRNKAKALTALAKLSSFESEVPEIASLRRSLRSDALEDLLDEALGAARKGDDLEAAAALQAALQAGEVSDALRGPAETGLDALKAGRYADAERAFKEALAAVPRSRVAQEGARAAQIRRAAAEREALATLKAKSPRSSQAIDVLAASFELSPASGAAREGRALLETRLQEQGLSDAEVAATLGWLTRLSDMDGETRARIEEGADLVEAGRFDAAEAAFSAAGAHPVAATGQSIARARVVGTLKASAATGDEAGADAIARLFERDPKDPQAQRGLEKLLSSAEAAADGRDDAEAARLLGLAARAHRASGDVAAALKKGDRALAAGDVAGAAAAYGTAERIAPGSPVTRRASALARRLEAQVLANAVSSGEVDAASAALAKTIERDPESPAAQKAVADLLAQAGAAMKEARFPEAAALYEAANAATRDEKVRAAVSGGHTLLGQNRLDDAVAAYASALSLGASTVGERARAAAQAARKVQLVKSAQALAALEEDAALERAALDVRTLLRQDPTQKEGRSAVSAVLDHADAAAARGEAKVVARDLGLVAEALGQSAVMRRALDMIRAGRLEEAEKSFTQTAGALAERGPAVVARLRVTALASSLDEGGVSAARSIRALLRVNPDDPTAKSALAAIFARLEAAADKGDGPAAAAALREADAATSANEQVSDAIARAATRLEGERFAEAEAVFVEARRKLPRAEVLERGGAASQDLRRNFEAASLDGLRAAEDPRPHAEALARSRVLEGSAATLGRGLKVALARAEAAQKAADLPLLARSLAAAGQLEATSSEGAVAMGEAADRIAKGELAAAETAYEGLRGQVATRGKALVRAARIARARAAVKAAADADRLLDEADANQALLELAPKDRQALARQRKLATAVRTTRVSAAKRQLELGKAGVAWMYLDRALRLEPKDRSALALRADAEAALVKRKDLILVIEAVRWEGGSAQACGPLDTQLQTAMMSELSKRTDLNGFVLSEGWTKAWRDKDPRAPVVTGGLAARVQSCRVTPGAGELAVAWTVETPKGAKGAAEGTATAAVAADSLLVDERDAAGNNVRKLLVDRALEALVEGLQAESAQVRQWLLTTAEHALAEENPELAADAFARFRMNPVKSADPERVEALEKALESAFR